MDNYLCPEYILRSSQVLVQLKKIYLNCWVRRNDQSLNSSSLTYVCEFMVTLLFRLCTNIYIYIMHVVTIDLSTILYLVSRDKSRNL
jgi:hypothetical protein